MRFLPNKPSFRNTTMLKRTFDLTISALLLMALSPLFLLVATAIKLDSKGPVFHRAIRAGKHGVPFTMYKFRTMVVGAAKCGPGLTRGGDPRVTRVGKWLRKYKIDEVPQLINVLRGEMSLVGPRPEDPRYVAHYTPSQRQVLSVRPGIASPAAIKYRHEEEVLAAAGGDLEEAYLKYVLPDKLWLDLVYVHRRSFLLDLAVLARVALSLLPGKGCRPVLPDDGKKLPVGEARR